MQFFKSYFNSFFPKLRTSSKILHWVMPKIAIFQRYLRKCFKNCCIFLEISNLSENMYALNVGSVVIYPTVCLQFHRASAYARTRSPKLRRRGWHCASAPVNDVAQLERLRTRLAKRGVRFLSSWLPAAARRRPPPPAAACCRRPSLSPLRACMLQLRAIHRCVWSHPGRSALRLTAIAVRRCL